MKYKTVDEWIPADGFILEPKAIDTVKSEQNVLVIAGPGAGKTELLAQRACFLLETNKCPYPQNMYSKTHIVKLSYLEIHPEKYDCMFLLNILEFLDWHS